MNTVALQSGMTPGVYPYTRTQCASSDTPESAQLIRQLKQELADTKKKLSKRDQRFEEKLREKDERIREQDERLAAQDEKILELIKRVPEQTTSPAKAHKKTKQKRATGKEMENRNRIIAAAAVEITLTYDRLPSVSEVMDKTALTQQQIYGSPSYKEGRIARASAITTEAMTGSSVQKSEFFGEKSEEHCRRRNRSKAEQAEIDVLADQQTADDSSPYVGT